jgi:retron-type reverse transcriptase
VTDGSVLGLIWKWIRVGVIEDGKLLVSETGTGQGKPISPLLANIYLHYVLDEWFEEVVKPRLEGEAYEIRFADDGAPRAQRAVEMTGEGRISTRNSIS